MSNIDKWNIIVSQYNKNLNSEEKIIQSNWELLFSSIFNYSDSDIIPQAPVQMGVATKYVDILIQQDREDLFVVELKKHALSQHDGQAQLFSYLKQSNNDIGILVCDKLYIYDFDYTKKDNNYSFVEIDFIKNNPDGEKFIELFMSNDFDKQKIRDFIRNKNQSQNNANLISKELSTDSVLQILKAHFSQKYPIEDVEKVLSGYRIEICLKSAVAPQVPKKIVPPVLGGVVSPGFVKGKDFTQYLLNGTPTGGKGSTVYAAVNNYVRNYSDITLQELQTVFPDDAAKPGFGKMLRLVEDVTPEQWSRSRFNRNPIILSNGQQIVISTQWKPDNMQSFIEYAKRAGLDIKPLS
ncbi:MAG: type I restriction enzyme HsdR N-terminal domain-containing protein [Spirochaetia bacterium]|nr:type I restriction enzyme HsdR N-terminal domain-containing protein [Spirochaetia bacterium]